MRSLDQEITIKFGSSDFYFYFFPDRQSENFQFMQRNPTNKKGVALHSLIEFYEVLWNVPCFHCSNHGQG